MTLIRSEAMARLRNWRDSLIGLGLVAAGLWLMRSPGYILPGLGAILALAGLAFGLVGLRRVRFRAGGEGPGVVQVVEGQISYFGPRAGGFVALDEISRLWLSADGADWVIRALDGHHLTIPRAAQGAEQLFDTFAALEGLDMARLLRRIEAAPSLTDQLIWQREARILLT